jgi:glycosyltransferase involved in cell wall biosynthesis
LKKIILFSHEYPPCLGGVGTIAEQIVNYFKNSQEFQVKVITSSRSLENKTEHLFCSFFLPQLWPFSYYLQYKEVFTEADVIICNDPAAIYTAGRYFSSELLSKTICCIHGEEKYLSSKNLFPSLVSFKKSFLKALKHSARVIFVSSYIKDYYLKNYGVKIDDLHGQIINPGVYSTVYLNAQAPLRTKNRFITVCRLHKDKGFIHMLKVFEYMKRVEFDFEWVIVGGGSYSETLHELINNSPVKSDITFVGRVDRADLQDYYLGSQFYILLSELNESYGLSYLEAAHFGVKPIGYNRCGVRDVFNYIDNGLLLNDYLSVVENATDIMSFVNDSKDLTANSSRLADSFSQDIEQVLLDLIYGNDK